MTITNKYTITDKHTIIGSIRINEITQFKPINIIDIYELKLNNENYNIYVLSKPSTINWNLIFDIVNGRNIYMRCYKTFDKEIVILLPYICAISNFLKYKI